MENIIFKNKGCVISHDNATNIVTAKWIGYLTLPVITEGCNELVEAVKSHKVSNHISDQRELSVLNDDARTYLFNIAFPNLDREGLKKVAVVTSENVFGKLSVNQVNTVQKQANKTKIEIVSFNTREECIDWLLK